MQKKCWTLPDYHLHTWRCGHAAGKMAEYVEAARAAGISEIGFADHVPMYWLPAEKRNPTLAMKEEDLPVYVAEVEKLRKENPDLVIRLGIEADYIPGGEEVLARLLSTYPFDYVLGSIHYIDGWEFDHPAEVEGYSHRDIDDVYDRYFALLQEAARSGLFDIMAHPDLVKKFGYRSRANPAPWYEQTARVLAGCGVCVEVNTAGLRAPAGEIYPAVDFLKACRKHGVPATAGSDAHSPAQVGYAREEARKLLLAAGYREAAIFQGRRLSLVPLF